MTRELITFEMSRQLFGIDMAAIREIREWAPIIQASDAPPYVVGMADLRGRLVPVIDLGARLGWGMTGITGHHAIIIVQQGALTAGLMIESLIDLVNLEEAALAVPPMLGPVPGEEEMTCFIDGLTPVGHRMLLVLNLEQLLEREWLGTPR